MIPLSLLFTRGVLAIILYFTMHCNLLELVCFTSYNDIIFSQSAQGIHITSCQNMLTNKNKYFPKIYSVHFYQFLMAKSIHVHFMCTFFYKPHVFCDANSDWLQLFLFTSNSNGHCVITKIWLTSSRVKSRVKHIVNLGWGWWYSKWIMKCLLWLKMWNLKRYAKHI
jgi:hypothetical protein